MSVFSSNLLSAQVPTYLCGLRQIWNMESLGVFFQSHYFLDPYAISVASFYLLLVSSSQTT